MKRVLYGTTALVAAGLAAGDTMAASGLKLGITGFYRNSLGASFGNSPTSKFLGPAGTTFGLGNFDRQNVSMRQEIRVNFTGETTLDNGITVGVLVGLNGESVAKSGSTTQVNRAYADFSGKFGLVRIGEATGALGTDCVGDPGNVTSNFGVNSPYQSFSNVGKGVFVAPQFNSGSGQVLNTAFGPSGPMASIGTCYGIESKGNKLMYFSPSFGGFTFSVSFAPQGSSRIAGGNLNYPSDGTNLKGGSSRGSADSVISIAANFRHDFDGWNLLVGGGGEWALQGYTRFGNTTGNKAAWYQGGVQVGVGRFAVGASGAFYQNYAQAGFFAQGASPSDDAWVATVGGSYSIDAWSFGLQGMYSQWDYGGGTIFSGSEDAWGVSLNGAYALGPGISLEAQLAYTSANYGGGFGAFVNPAFSDFTFGSIPTVHSWEIDMGTAIDF